MSDVNTTGLNLQTLGHWLAQHVHGFTGPLRAEKFAGGQSNPTYKLLTPTATYVMRCKPGPVSQLLPSAHAIEREFRVMQALARTAVPVPEMLVLCEDESIIGRAFYVMEYKAGRLFWEPDLPSVALDQRMPIYAAMNKVLATLHSIEPAAIGLQDYGKAGNYFERQIGRWSKQYQASITQPITAMDQLMAWLPQHIPDMALDPQFLSIVHGDYRIDNLLFDPLQPQVVAVLDWELSTLGHPLADFSYHCMAWHIEPGVFKGMGGIDTQALGLPSEHEYMALYCQHTGFAQPEQLQREWNFYLAYNLFRLAAILQGIAKRLEAGIASSAQAHQYAAAARPLAELGWRFAQQH
jgi:aminoglycoside phosphotransferase (APT) family kinase protein